MPNKELKWQKSNPGKLSYGKPGQGQNQNNSDKPYVSYQSPKGPNWNSNFKKGKKNFKGKKRANQAIFDLGLQLEPIQFANMATVEETPIKQESLTPPLEFDKDKGGYGSPPPSLATTSESSKCDSDSGRESPIIIMITSENSPLSKGKKREFFPLKKKPDEKKKSDLKKKGDALIN